MRQIAWLGVAAALTSAAVGCSGDDSLFDDPGGASGASGSAGAPSASGGAVTGGSVNAGSGGSPLTGGTTSGGTQSGGTQSGGTQSGGTQSGGSSTAAGAPAGGISAGGSAAGAGGAGGRGTTGGRFGSGGRNSGGRSSTGGGTMTGTGGSTPGTPAECSLTREGATGDEPGGLIPVCCTPAAAEKTLIEEVFTLLNEHRMANGESALAYDTELESAIQGHCVHMSQHSFFAHEAEETGVVTPWDRAKLCGTSANGENIAQGQRSPADVMEDWTNSSGHNQNMLASNFTRVGIGYAADGRYWGQLFAQ